MLDINKLDTDILDNLRNRGHSDERIAAMTPEKALDEHLAWILGYPGWGKDMLMAWQSIQEAAKESEAKPAVPAQVANTEGQED